MAEAEAERETVKKPKWHGGGTDSRAQVALLNTKEAAKYLGVNRQTINNYKNTGKLKPVSQAPGKQTLYSSKELDSVRIMRSVRHTVGGAKASKDVEAVEEDFDAQLLALVEKGSSGIVKEALESGASDGELQRGMRQQAAGLIVHNKLLERLAVLAIHPRPDIQQKAIATLVSYVLPRLQSTEVVMKRDPAEEKFQKDLMDNMNKIRLDMEKARFISYGPITDATIVDDPPVHEGLQFPQPDLGEERLLSEQDYQGSLPGTGQDGPLLSV